MQINININDGLRALGYGTQVMYQSFNGVTRIQPLITITQTLYGHHGIMTSLIFIATKSTKLMSNA